MEIDIWKYGFNSGTIYNLYEQYMHHGGAVATKLCAVATKFCTMSWI